MKFIVLLQKLEQQLGYHQVPINAHAHRLQDVFECSPLHHDLMLRLIQAIYKQNGCTSMFARVELESTQVALSEIRLGALKANNTDVDLFKFIDDLCYAVEDAFANSDRRRNQDLPTTNQTASSTVKDADIIDLANYRQRKANSSVR